MKAASTSSTAPTTAPRIGLGARLRRLGRPSDIPAVEQAAASAWAAGWWGGIAVGVVNGLALAVLLGWLR